MMKPHHHDAFWVLLGSALFCAFVGYMNHWAGLVLFVMCTLVVLGWYAMRDRK